jgi:hypothetical protein
MSICSLQACQLRVADAECHRRGAEDSETLYQIQSVSPDLVNLETLVSAARLS